MALNTDIVRDQEVRFLILIQRELTMTSRYPSLYQKRLFLSNNYAFPSIKKRRYGFD